MSNQDMYWSINGKFTGCSLGTAERHGIKNDFRGSIPCESRNESSVPSIIIQTSSTNKSGMSNSSGFNSRRDMAHLFPSPAAGVSKSEQMLHRLQRDQLEVAYIDHRNNLRTAQSYAAFQKLKGSEPRLDISPGSSTNSSPCRCQRRQKIKFTRSSSPIYGKFGESAFSSGSENSSASSQSVPPNHQRGHARLHGGRSNHQLLGGMPWTSQTAPCSPVHHRKTDSPIPQHTASPAAAFGSNLLLQAYTNILWGFISDAVKCDDLERLEDRDPRQWWKRLFLVLKRKHGAAKASSIAGQLLGNPEVLEAIQNKLAGMVGERSGYVQNLPKSVQRRVKALKKLQYECTKIEADFYKDVHLLECKYAERYNSVFSKRHSIVSGGHEPTDEECEWPSSDEEDDEDDGDAESKEVKKVTPEPEDKPTKGISSFWSTTFKSVELLSSMIQEHDDPILEHLTDVKVKFSTDPMGFTLEFYFDENEYFTDKVLTKWYEMRSVPDENDPFGFEGPEIVSCKGCKINWKEGKNVTVSIMKKKQKNAKTGGTRTVTKPVQNDSFFNFFSPPPIPELAIGEDLDEDTEALLQADYEIGHFIRERLVPHAVLYFTGEAVQDDDEDDEDDDEEDDLDDGDYDEDEDPDYDPTKDPKYAAANKECKQQ